MTKTANFQFPTAKELVGGAAVIAIMLVTGHAQDNRMNTLAERYVRLVLAVGQHDADYVDAYYGPPEWRKDAETGKLPLAGIATLALLIGGLLLVHGAGSVMVALKRKPGRGWGWILFDGALSIVLAILIAAGWPASSIPIIGLLAGFSLISAGVWRVMLARALRAELPPQPV